MANQCGKDRLGMLLLLAGLLLPLSARAEAPMPGQEQCVAPPELARFTVPLPHTAARIHAGEPLTIVAIGSSSTSGWGASSQANSYPSQLASDLRAHYPKLELRVLNKGVGGETAPQMLSRFDRDVMAAHPDLVIWQVGTNTLLHNDDLSAHDKYIHQGLQRLQVAGIDVIVMNPQFAPKVTANPDHAQIVHDINAACAEKRVAVFHRFEIMRHWVLVKRQQFAALLAPDQLHMNDFSYACVARLLADAIIAAVD